MKTTAKLKYWFLIQYHLFMRMIYTWRYYRNIALADKHRARVYRANNHLKHHSEWAIDILKIRLNNKGVFDD